MTKQLTKHCRTWLQVTTFLLVACSAPLARADLQLPILKSGTVTYSNVTVYSQTEQDLYISHAQGLGNIKISTLDDDSLRALGLKEENKQTDTVMARGVSQTMDKLKTSLGTMHVGGWAGLSEKLQVARDIKLSRQTLGIVVGVTVLLYVSFCFCLKLICYNAGAPAGPLIWFPVLQMFPLLRAAKMSGWCFLLFLIPLVNVAMYIWWSFRIAKACGKGALVAVLLILPVTSLFAFLYLALSKGQPEAQTPGEEKNMRRDSLAHA